MVVVKVVVEGLTRPTRPIIVMWRNADGFGKMIDMVIAEAAKKQTPLDVEVRCFERG